MKYTLLVICAFLFFHSDLQAKKSVYPKKIDGFVFVPSGSFMPQGSTYSIHAMFVADHEVTNGEYLQFIKDLVAQKRTEDLKTAIPDTAAWNMPGTYMNAYVEHYFRHPAYADFPVVNISVEGAKLYCIWLGEKLSALYENERFKGMRLPTTYEWIYAASGGMQNTVYSWGSPYVRNSSGEMQGNFLVLGDESISYNDSTYRIMSGANVYGIAGNLSDYADVTAPSKSYKPNAYGLYNMSGNVAELVHDFIPGDSSLTSNGYAVMGGSWKSPGYDVRITSKTQFTKANPTVGFRPVFTAVME
jgi:sulfatase modifying factor 1